MAVKQKSLYKLSPTEYAKLIMPDDLTAKEQKKHITDCVKYMDNFGVNEWWKFNGNYKKEAGLMAKAQLNDRRVMLLNKKRLLKVIKKTVPQSVLSEITNTKTLTFNGLIKNIAKITESVNLFTAKSKDNQKDKSL